MARKKLQPVTREDARAIGAMLRGLRRAAGYRAVQDAAAAGGFPAARQTIYAYERGGLTPSLQQFTELPSEAGLSIRRRPLWVLSRRMVSVAMQACAQYWAAVVNRR